jgi:hypothetical protein
MCAWLWPAWLWLLDMLTGCRLGIVLGFVPPCFQLRHSIRTVPVLSRDLTCRAGAVWQVQTRNHWRPAQE